MEEIIKDEYSYSEVQNLMASFKFLKKNPFEGEKGIAERSCQKIFANVLEKLARTMAYGFVYNSKQVKSGNLRMSQSHIGPLFILDDKEMQLQATNGANYLYSSSASVKDNANNINYAKTEFSIGELQEGLVYKGDISVHVTPSMACFNSRSFNGTFARRYFNDIDPKKSWTSNSLTYPLFLPNLENKGQKEQEDIIKRNSKLTMFEIQKNISNYMKGHDIDEMLSLTEKDMHLWDIAKEHVREQLKSLNLPFSWAGNKEK